MKQNTRDEKNYDLLVIIITVAIIMIHVAHNYLSASFDYNFENFNFTFKGNLFFSFFLDTLPRFAIQVYAMILGAVLLRDERNKNIRSFYSRSFEKVGITVVIFSVCYTVFSLIMAGARCIVKKESLLILIEPFKDLFLGKPFYHMWYVYMLLGIFILTPFLIIIKDSIGEKMFCRVSWVFLAVATISYLSRPYSFEVGWDVGIQIEFLGYFFVGFTIKRWADTVKPSNVYGGLLILSGIAVELLLSWLRYRQVLDGGTLSEEKTAFDFLAYEGLAPLIVVSSVLIFAGFSIIKNTRKFPKLSDLMMIVYLFHAGVWYILRAISKNFRIFPPDTIFSTLFSVALVFFVSLLCASIYKKIFERIDGKYKITEKILALFALGYIKKPEDFDTEEGQKVDIRK